MKDRILICQKDYSCLLVSFTKWCPFKIIVTNFDKVGQHPPSEDDRSKYTHIYKQHNNN